MMKKIKYAVLLVFCLGFLGCNNEFAETEYENAEKFLWRFRRDRQNWYILMQMTM